MFVDIYKFVQTEWRDDDLEDIAGAFGLAMSDFVGQIRGSETGSVKDFIDDGFELVQG